MKNVITETALMLLVLPFLSESIYTMHIRLILIYVPVREKKYNDCITIEEMYHD